MKTKLEQMVNLVFASAIVTDDEEIASMSDHLNTDTDATVATTQSHIPAVTSSTDVPADSARTASLPFVNLDYQAVMLDMTNMKCIKVNEKIQNNVSLVQLASTNKTVITTQTDMGVFPTIPVFIGRKSIAAITESKIATMLIGRVLGVSVSTHVDLAVAGGTVPSKLVTYLADESNGVVAVSTTASARFPNANITSLFAVLRRYGEVGVQARQVIMINNAYVFSGNNNQLQVAVRPVSSVYDVTDKLMPVLYHEFTNMTPFFTLDAMSVPLHIRQYISTRM